MARRPPRTLVEVAAERFEANGAGRVRSIKMAADVMATVGCLAIAGYRSENGWPTQAQYAAYWKMDERTAQREWSRFREAFPEEGTPDRLAQAMVLDFGARMAQAKPAAGLSLPADLVTA